MSDSSKQQDEKAIRLIDYLLRLASLRTKLIRNISDYERILWISSVPHEKNCFTQAWGRNEEYDSDVWIEVQNQREPELPSVPAECEDWVDRSSLRNKKDLPELLSEITVQVKNLDWQAGNDEPEHISQTEHIEKHPEVQQAWDRYVEGRWLLWMEEHNRWESIHKVYSALFAIHQEQIRLGEEYELVLGLGLLAWKTPTGQRVCRHLIVANAILDFEARLGKFIVRPMPDGAVVRPELDMLDIEERPVHAEETAKSSLSSSNDDPWDKGRIEGVLQALVNSISSRGEYDNTLEKKSILASDKPVVEYAPALILRKRSAKGLTETLKKIKDSIEKGAEIPPGFGDLAEIRPKRDAEQNDEPNDPGNTNYEFDGEVFFPKPSNKEQRRIVDKIRAATGVLVQGPPGTGKSHTIANLICHLLATGNRILVTAKTPRALQVLMGKSSQQETDDGLIPRELRPLCINLLGSGLEERQSLESSVGGILRKNEEWSENLADNKRAKLEGRLQNLREEKVKINRRLRDIRESETHSQSVAEGTYRGTAARIAEAVNRDRKACEWFTDTAVLNHSCPVAESDLQNILIELRHFTPEKQGELSLVWPETSIDSERFADLIQNEKRATEEECNLSNGADEHITNQLSMSSSSLIEAICDAFSDFQNAQKNLIASPHGWICDAIHDVLGNNSSLWYGLFRATSETIDSIENIVATADDTVLVFPNDVNIRALHEDVCTLKEYIGNDGKLGWGPFRSKVVKERIYVIKAVRVNGRPCSSLDHFSTLADVLNVRIEFEKAWGFWVGRAEKTEGPYTLQLHAIKALCDSLENALSLTDLIAKCRDKIKQCPAIDEPVWSDEFQIERLIASCRLALARHHKRLAIDEIQKIEAPLSSIATENSAHPVTNEMLQAIRQRDKDAYAQSMNKRQGLDVERKRIEKLEENVAILRNLVPELINELKRTPDDSCWDERLRQIQNAWHWAQARYWIEEYIRQDDVPALQERVHQIETEIHGDEKKGVSGVIAKLASLRAWSFCCARLTDDHRQHMEAWCKHTTSLTKTGRGKRDFRNRQAAQRSLNECKDAVPAWVMPLHRVWDTVAPSPGMFDVIIVDEASQCGFEALPLFYLGKKVLIVGDDKQISPGGEFQEAASVNALMEEYLYDFKFKEYFDVNISLFAHGKLRCGTQRIRLLEHFRCMPEIIRFSNDLCYSDQPLVPLRQYGIDRLSPLEHVFVEGGHREGSGLRVINKPEADAVVEKIVELCNDNRYIEKTIGVVVLQGEAQGFLIESQLLELLGAEEMEKRRLVCGNPYSFQGDERDIMLISMITASDIDGKIKEGRTDEKRYNVAMSRARDQVWLFHSVTCNDLSSAYLRKPLLEFFENSRPQEIAGIERDELERRASQDNRVVVKPPSPFDSWFEVDVALVLVRKGFEVIPQYEFAGKRIDLVVQYGPRQLAVECDGDYWHGPEQYEADMERQRQLERCEWEFFRVRESSFYLNREDALIPLWQMLEERGILASNTKPSNEASEEKSGNDENGPDETEDYDSDHDGHNLSPGENSPDIQSKRHPEEISSSEISGAIVRVLKKCPNHSCTSDSLTGRVLKEVGVRTRGKLRVKFEKRINRIINTLVDKDLIEKYRAKNKRVRLLKVSQQNDYLF